VKLRVALLALVAAVAVGVGSSQATVSNISVTLGESSPYEYVVGTTLYYAPTGSNADSFTLTASASTTSSLTGVDFPALTGMMGGGTDTTSPYQANYSWTSSSTASGPFDVTVHDSDPSSLTAVSAFTVMPDTTAPTGQAVALTGGPNYTTLSVPLSLTTPAPGPLVDAGAGLDPASGELWRAAATLSGGTCGTFGAPVKIQGPAVLPAAFADTTVSSSNCYQYTYKISDFVGNQSTSSASAVAKVSTVGPTVTDTAPTEVSGANDQYWSSVSDTLFFRPAATGSFTLNANASDSSSGISQVAFPDVSPVTGWAGSTGGVDSTSPYASPATYTWTAGATAPGASHVVATNGTGLTAFDTITISADSAAPTGQAVALSGGPWYTSSVALTVTPGTDAGSGVDASRSVVERASATLTNGACGTFGTFAAVTLSGGADTNTASGNCYRYQAKATDNVGNASTASAASADAKVDKTAPTTPSLLFTGLSDTAADGNVVYFRPGGSGQFTVTAAASDSESGIASFTFPNIPGTTSVGSGPHRTYLFSNLTAASGPFTISAQNGAGMSSSAATFSLAPDATAPKLAVRCNGSACSSSPYAKAVTIAFAATDSGGSGIGTIRWTTDGTDPKIDHGNEYLGTFSVESLTHLEARAFDKAGNPSALLTVTVKSLANRLLFVAPATAVVGPKSDHVRAKMTSNRRALVRATMTGPGLKKPLHWNFILPSGASIVQLRLPETLKRPGTYRVVWTAVANVRTTQRTTRVTLKK
jgi:chitobiase/beta-hexosaminidase-like protein